MTKPIANAKMQSEFVSDMELFYYTLGDENNPPLPNPSHYSDWFLYYDSIDIRKHLIDVEEVLIKAAIEKNSGHITKASESLRLNRTTLIEKMKKLSINQ